MANAKVRAAKAAAKQEEVVPEFKNLPVRPKNVPIDIPAGYRWVFARTVALELLEGSSGEDPRTTGILKLSNKELEAELLNARVMYPEFMGGVVDDGKPNGMMPYPEHFRHNQHE
jgi:hypothetical protein